MRRPSLPHRPPVLRRPSLLRRSAARAVASSVASSSEEQALNKARRSITLRIALVMSAVIACIGAVVYVVMLTQQQRDTNRELNYGVMYAHAPSTPGCVWVITAHNGLISKSPGTPADMPVRASIDEVAAGHAAITQQVSANGTRYALLTERRGDDVYQVVLDMTFLLADRDDLLLALGLAELCGLIAAGVAGGFLARRAMAPLGEALGRQRRFVADASHELRTPLTQLHTRTQLLLRRADRGELTNEQLSAELTKIVAGTRQLGDVVTDLLLSTQLGAGPGERVPLDLFTLVNDAADAEAARATLNGLTVRVHGEPERYLVTGAETALRRVIAALLDNAVGHTLPGGEIVLTVDSPARGTVRLTVRDNGVGFDPADGERIFARFARGGAGRGRRFGLGLALVREVVDNHNGSIEAEGRLGEGATFTVLLPAAPVSDPATSAPRPMTPAGVLARTQS